MKIEAPAKLNLFLYVLGRRPDGYHDLLTLFQKISLCDEVHLEKATGITLEVSGEAPPGRENLCFRAAEIFLERAAIKGGVFIRLKKRIPAGTGLGGASSDAAAVLKGLSKLYPGHLSEAELFEVGRSLGADVPFFLSSYSTALGEGIGDRLSPWPTLPAWYVVVVPPFRISTAWAYRNLRLTKRETPLINGPENFSWDKSLVNDFKDLVFEKYPELSVVEAALYDAGALKAGLSGSGSALFGVFEEQGLAERAAERLRERFKDYQVLVARNFREGETCLSIT
ncbi:4-(cytidine 5'-diphospho)-2-C-methyl-D-erythritol kinase [Thermosulfurimonas dismutans]|uniref:4-diphosphocytidyl-2-C-methyl-D-erythritol kinase n=1 Tax=Thermosulfurimonas dismutans TaxID=999894 RepID=A0A179D546_9BACT|nr:4-(cytidine 5'-diphospho)-2-C-methyl-D-erythritol kinase [Thermosulfurimonas dismutans]OAQ20582.1 4-diphosphocytidyl-2-C-methyl-D-erythritol kinase [Thermosulfurimonas dismutans]